MRRRRVLVAVVAAALAAAVTVAEAQTTEVGPASKLQPSGRQLVPRGKLTALGNEPGGAALTPNGEFLWTVSAGRGRNDIRIVDAAPELGCARGKRGRRCRRRAPRRAGRVVQTIALPGASGGIALAADGRTAYVAGVADSSHLDQRAPRGTPGLAGDAIHVFHYDARSGKATRAGAIAVPAPGDAQPAQDFPPKLTRIAWPRDIAVSRDGRTLLVALNLADRAAIVDTHTHAVTYVAVGGYPYGAAIARDGKGLVTNEADGTVSLIDLHAHRKLADVTVGAHLSHPEGIAVDPKADRAYVAVAGEDVVAVVNTASQRVERTLSVGRPQGIGTSPTALSVTADGCRLLASDSGEDAVAVFALRPGCDTRRGRSGRSPRRGRRRRRRGAPHIKRAPSFTGKVAAAAQPIPLIGRVPVGSYPVFAAATPGREHLVWVAEKGVGVGPNPRGPNPLAPDDTDDRINDYQYLPSIVGGAAGALAFPTDAELRAATPAADREIVPVNAELPPAGTPLAPNGKIQHVFYIVKENRTYDQVFGDDPRGNGDPRLALFPQSVTPNEHALAQRFPLLDHVFANSEASIDGHFWTSAAAVSDYVVKNWQQNYAGRGRPYDFGVYAITWPPKGFLFDQADREGISYFNYGEAVAGVVPLPDRNRTLGDNQGVLRRFSHSDIGEPGVDLGAGPAPATNCYPNDASIGSDPITKQRAYDASLPPGAPPGSLSRVDCFRSRFATQLATTGVPAFNYLVLPSDHTNGLQPGQRSPLAMVADNDRALGEIVDTISHSAIWGTSLVLVVEDDSQDGADHLDAHRIPALAISPYARRGAVVHTRYDFPSFIRTLELPIGMTPLNLFDALGTPLYDAFDTTPQNSEAFSALPANVDLNQQNPNSASARRATRGLDLTHTDRVSQQRLDGMLWRAVHGNGSAPPPPGPNAAPARSGDG